MCYVVTIMPDVMLAVAVVPASHTAVSAAGTVDASLQPGKPASSPVDYGCSCTSTLPCLLLLLIVVGCSCRLSRPHSCLGNWNSRRKSPAWQASKQPSRPWMQLYVDPAMLDFLLSMLIMVGYSCRPSNWHNRPKFPFKSPVSLQPMQAI